MRQTQSIAARILRQEPATAQLDLVVPFTTGPLTLAALAAAGRLGSGLHAAIRLVMVQAVPYPLDIAQSPVPIGFLEQQLRRMPCGLPVHCEVRLAREVSFGLKSILDSHSLVVLATAKRPWRTRNERLARSLRRDGFNVVLVAEGKTDNA